MPSNETEEETNKVVEDETTDEQHPGEENPEEDVVPVDEETNPEVEEEEEKKEESCKTEEPVEAEIKAQEEEEEEVKEETEKEENEKKSIEEMIQPADERQKEEETKNSPVSDPLGAAIVLQSKGPLNEDVPAVAPVESVTSIVPGTTLRRLEDPTPFLFSRPGTLGSLNAGQPITSTSLSDAKPKAPRYRVLEAPGMMNEPPVVVAHPKIHELPKPFQNPLNESSSYEHPLQSSSAAPMMTSSSPYKGRVLEAPSSPPKAATFTSSPSSDSLTSSRSLASDVLEKARTRFDRFWTKKESDK